MNHNIMNSKSFKSQAPGTLGLCLFCSSKGKHKSLDKDYYCYGIKEVYQDLIADCFNVQLCTSKSVSKLICLQCVERLREALGFKEMVLKALGKLQDPLSAPGNYKETEHSIPEVIIKFEEDTFDVDSNGSAEEQQESQVDLVTNMEYAMVPGELELLQRFHMAAKALPTSVPDRFRMYLDSLRNTVVTAKDVAEILRQTEEGTFKRLRRLEEPLPQVIREKDAHVSNLANVLMYSNVTPFRGKNTNGILCFYCGKAYQTIDSIRDHTKEVHSKDSVRKHLWRYGTEAIKMYVDVNNLKCNICHESLPDLIELRTHLSSVHRKVFYKQFTDRVVPFDMAPKSNFICQCCEAEYVTFGSLERHMNNHFRNYICKECGNGFITKHRLKVHVTSVHVIGSFPCKFCKKTFPTQLKMRCHERSHITNKRFRCPNCSLRFTDYFLRAKHLTDAHGVKALTYNCKVCDKRFVRGNALTRHMKRDHLENRDFHCDVCPYTCFSFTELKHHNVKHTGERSYQCKVCSKSYARLKTLKEHLRIHSNDRRFICAACGQAFVQKCSLKGHIKTHHPDYPCEEQVSNVELSV